jgi:putative hydrolase of the HAD superfamily
VTPSTLPPREAIDAVIFDAGGVLLLPDAEAGMAAIAEFHDGSVPADWRRAHYAALLALEQMEPIDWLAHRRVVAAEVGVRTEHLDAAAALIDDVMTSPWVPVDGAADTLRALSAAGYKLAVVSNAWGTIAEWLEHHKVCSVTDDELPRVGAVIDSHVVGVEKPDPRIFRFALDALDVAPERSLYVGDTVRFDVKGALAAGLRPVHVDPFHLCDGEHNHIVSLAELTDWLAAD